MAYVLILFGVILRFLPHPANFAPIAAIGLFSGCHLKKKYAFLLPLAAMLISDYFIGFYSWKIMISVYLSFALIGLIGVQIGNHKTVYTVLGGSLLGSVLFYLITNFAVWVFGSLYPHTWAGLLWCYTAAIPFFRNTVLGDLFYVSTLFGAYELARLLLENKIPNQSTRGQTSS